MGCVLLVECWSYELYRKAQGQIYKKYIALRDLRKTPGKGLFYRAYSGVGEASVGALFRSR